jgi:hypothetical protein
MFFELFDVIIALSFCVFLCYKRYQSHCLTRTTVKNTQRESVLSVSEGGNVPASWDPSTRYRILYGSPTVILDERSTYLLCQDLQIASQPRTEVELGQTPLIYLKQLSPSLAALLP